MISFLKNPPSPPFAKGGYRMQILSVFSQLILNSFMNVYLILQGQTFIVSLVKPVAYLSLSYSLFTIAIVGFWHR